MESPKNEWQGVSRHYVEKTPVTSLPFVTNFNVGNGDDFYQNGTKVKEGTFNNRSIQDVLPTYRWVIDNEAGNPLEAAISYEDAFNGDSSIKLSGMMEAQKQTFIKLYASQVKVNTTDTVTVVTKGASEAALVLELKGKEQPTTIQGQQETLANSWVQTTYSLKVANCQTVTAVSLNVKNTQSGPASIYLGQLKTGKEKTVVDDLTESIRMSWDTKVEKNRDNNQCQ